MTGEINKETIKRGLATFAAFLMVLSVFAGGLAGSAAAHDLTTQEWDNDSDWDDSNSIGENNTVEDDTVTLDDDDWMTNPFEISSVSEIESVSVTVDDLGAGMTIEVQDASSGDTIENWNVDSAGGHTFDVTSDVSFSSDKHLRLIPNDTSDPATVSYLSVDNDETNTDPVAQAGSDQTIVPGEEVTVDASNSTDSDGDTLTYEYSINGGTFSPETTDSTYTHFRECRDANHRCPSV